MAPTLLVLTFTALEPTAHAQEPPPPPPTGAAPVAPSSPPPLAPPSEAAVPPDPGRTARTSVFAEAFGNGVTYSVNAERFLTDNVSVRAGFGYLRLSETSTTTGGTAGAPTTSTSTGPVSVVTVPVLANYYIGSASERLELGLGVTFVDMSAPVTSGIGSSFGGPQSGLFPMGTAVIGYRYIPLTGGVTFGIAFTPFFWLGGFQAWSGASVGGVF